MLSVQLAYAGELLIPGIVLAVIGIVLIGLTIFWPPSSKPIVTSVSAVETLPLETLPLERAPAEPSWEIAAHGAGRGLLAHDHAGPSSSIPPPASSKITSAVA